MWKCENKMWKCEITKLPLRESPLYLFLSIFVCILSFLSSSLRKASPPVQPFGGYFASPSSPPSGNSALSFAFHFSVHIIFAFFSLSGKHPFFWNHLLWHLHFGTTISFTTRILHLLLWHWLPRLFFACPQSVVLGYLGELLHIPTCTNLILHQHITNRPISTTILHSKEIFPIQRLTSILIKTTFCFFSLGTTLAPTCMLEFVFWALSFWWELVWWYRLCCLEILKKCYHYPTVRPKTSMMEMKHGIPKSIQKLPIHATFWCMWEPFPFCASPSRDATATCIIVRKVLAQSHRVWWVGFQPVVVVQKNRNKWLSSSNCPHLSSNGKQLQQICTLNPEHHDLLRRSVFSMMHGRTF